MTPGGAGASDPRGALAHQPTGADAPGPVRHAGDAGQRPAAPWPIRWPEDLPAPGVAGERVGRPALTILELLVAAAIVVTAAAVAVPIYVRNREAGRVLLAIADIRAMDHEIYVYESTGGGPPPNLSGIGRGGLRDPWGRPYEYSVNTGSGTGHDRRDRLFKPLNTDYDLFSKGKDGQTQQKLDQAESVDDVVRALNGAYIGLAADF